MDLSDTTKAQAVSVKQLQQDDRHQILESAISTVTAVKRLVAEYDRMKGERETFERQFTDALAENQTLRRQIKEATAHREHFLNALATLTGQMDEIGTRCIEAVKVARAQTNDQLPATVVSLPSTDGRSPAEQPAVPDAGSSPAAQRALPSAPDAGRGPMGEPLMQGAHVFAQYLSQQ